MHQLKGANPIAGDGVDDFSSAAMRASMEFSGHHISPVKVLTVAAGGIMQQPPVARMLLNDFITKLIKLTKPVQLAQALPGPGEVFGYPFRVILRFKNQLAIQIIGILPVAVVIGTLGLLANLQMSCLGRPYTGGHQHEDHDT